MLLSGQGETHSEYEVPARFSIIKSKSVCWVCELIKNYAYDLWPCDFRVHMCGYAFVRLDSSAQIDSNWPCVFSRATHFPKVCFRFSASAFSLLVFVVFSSFFFWVRQQTAAVNRTFGDFALVEWVTLELHNAEWSTLSFCSIITNCTIVQ